MTSARHVALPTFVDTGAYYASAAPRDPDPDEAVDIFRRLARRRTPLYTTTLIIAETHVILKSRLSRSNSRQSALSSARRFIEGIYASAIRIEPVTPVDERNALALLGDYADQDFSFTEATSFVVMKWIGITYAFTFDNDSAIAGFTDVRSVL